MATTGRARRGAAVAVVLAAIAGCGPAPDPAEPTGRAAAEPKIITHESAATTAERQRVEQYWTGRGIADLASTDRSEGFVQPQWDRGGVIARTVGRLYVAGDRDGACTATVVGAHTVVTAAHCVRTPLPDGSSRAAIWDGNLYFVPGYRDGQSPHGGFTVREVHMAEDWQADGNDVAMLEMNPAADGRSVSAVVGGAQRIAFDAAPGGAIHQFGYPYTSRVLHCAGPGTQPGDAPQFVRIPCIMGVGSSGGPYVVHLDPTGTGTVVAVNVSSDSAYSYGTVLGPLAGRLHARSEQG
ncbi:trypsin-like serine peptidase [Streptomyces sp. NPDC091268]|uniref:trypsin-like serine peptidase n=1 Tax=Streptomyces sp. NPDC091268 TaxID=3365979 RepID=UPI00382D2A4A